VLRFVLCNSLTTPTYTPFSYLHKTALAVQLSKNICVCNQVCTNNRRQVRKPAKIFMIAPRLSCTVSWWFCIFSRYSVTFSNSHRVVPNPSCKWHHQRGEYFYAYVVSTSKYMWVRVLVPCFWRSSYILHKSVQACV